MAQLLKKLPLGNTSKSSPDFDCQRSRHGREKVIMNDVILRTDGASRQIQNKPNIGSIAGGYTQIHYKARTWFPLWQWFPILKTRIEDKNWTSPSMKLPEAVEGMKFRTRKYSIGTKPDCSSGRWFQICTACFMSKGQSLTSAWSGQWSAAWSIMLLAQFAIV